MRIVRYSPPGGAESVTNTPPIGMDAGMRLIYCAAMERLHSMPAWLRALLANFALWTLLCALAGITTYGDAVHYGDTRSYWRMTAGWWCGYVVMMMQSYGLYMMYLRHPAWLATPGRVTAGYLAYVVACWPIAMLGLAFRRCFKFDIEPTLPNAWAYVTSMEKIEWFVVYALLTMSFGFVVAVLLWSQRQQRERELAQARLAALRGQLEPHFMFNTLSAIGAMVRMDDKPVALEGLSRLGDLLQYALAGSERDWVALEHELQFILDYLDLQKLRFGERLQVRIEGMHLLDQGIECPPMLLQPLLENALRHDLECHEDVSDIVLRFTREGERLKVQVSNPVHAHAAPPAGLGIGLRGIRARLQLAYGETASLVTENAAGRFVAELNLPWRAAE